VLVSVRRGEEKRLTGIIHKTFVSFYSKGSQPHFGCKLNLGNHDFYDYVNSGNGKNVYISKFIYFKFLINLLKITCDIV
jgi:hypothetical protein